MIKNTITQFKCKFSIIFAKSFKYKDDETLYGWYDAVLEGK